jgi:cytochrome c553
MRILAFGILLLAACDRNSAGTQAAEVTPAAISFDGALAQGTAAKIAHGRRIADVLGCTGCHGAKLQGERFYEAYASNLTREIPKYSDAQFERLMRAGEHPTGRDVWGMPSEIFQHLSDDDLAALLAYLRSLEPAGEPTQPALPFAEETKRLIAKGEYQPAANFVRGEKALAPIDLGAGHALGRYISRVTCAECHGAELRGRGNPDLIVASGYSREEFDRLMTQGIAIGGRKLKPMMEGVSRDRFSQMTPRERGALYAYLKARAEAPQ